MYERFKGGPRVTYVARRAQVRLEQEYRIVCIEEIRFQSLNSRCVRTRTICQRMYSVLFHPKKRYRLNSIDATIHMKSSKVINWKQDILEKILLLSLFFLLILYEIFLY